MEVKELIFKEIENVPEPYLIEILDFIRFLETKAVEQKMELAIASESSLNKFRLAPARLIKSPMPSCLFY